MMKDPFICPHCGKEVPAKANACPHCGSDEETGWADNAEFSYIEPGFDEKDYEELKEKEFGETPIKKKWSRYFSAALAAALIALWLYYWAR